MSADVDDSASERSVVPSDPALAKLVMKVVAWAETMLQTEVLPSPEMRGAWRAVGVPVFIKAEPIGRAVVVFMPKVALHWVFKTRDEDEAALRDFFTFNGLIPA